MTWDDDRQSPTEWLLRHKDPTWRRSQREKEAMPEHPRWERDYYFRSPDGLHQGLSVQLDSPVMQQRVRDWLVLSFDKRNVPQWIHDLIERELPKEGWDLRDGWDPKVLLKPKDPES
ncbi:hypothetical protein [Bradyrhizobium australafricanum]|uniref:hypothetical protein n=1 Tax=Bradyrhizobium australafricanum TaxID=2821406 RepID=UPI001CE2BB37|nr:hypothetical protein [Bradyrhizobium australafricanum]MCA6098154.1 hypothetical protein [Bradyrhizobium australafricanum]